MTKSINATFEADPRHQTLTIDGEDDAENGRDITWQEVAIATPDLLPTEHKSFPKQIVAGSVSVQNFTSTRAMQQSMTNLRNTNSSNMTANRYDTPEEARRTRNTVFQRTQTRSKERLVEVIEGKKLKQLHLSGT